MEKLHIFTLPEENRKFWAIVQSVALPVAALLMAGEFSHDIWDFVGLTYVLWSIVVVLPFEIQLIRITMGPPHYIYGHRMMFAVLLILSPFLYLRNLWLLIAEKE